MVIQVTEANLGTVKYRHINSAKLFTLHLNLVYPSLRLKVLKKHWELCHTTPKPGRGTLARRSPKARPDALEPPNATPPALARGFEPGPEPCRYCLATTADAFVRQLWGRSSDEG